MRAGTQELWLKSPHQMEAVEKTFSPKAPMSHGCWAPPRRIG